MAALVAKSYACKLSLHAANRACHPAATVGDIILVRRGVIKSMQLILGSSILVLDHQISCSDLT